MITKLTEQTWDVTHEGVREDLWWFSYALSLGWHGKTNGPVVNGLPSDDVKFYKGWTCIWQSGFGGVAKWSARDDSPKVRQYASLKRALDVEGRQ